LFKTKPTVKKGMLRQKQKGETPAWGMVCPPGFEKKQ